MCNNAVASVSITQQRTIPVQARENLHGYDGQNRIIHNYEKSESVEYQALSALSPASRAKSASCPHAHAISHPRPVPASRACEGCGAAMQLSRAFCPGCELLSAAIMLSPEVFLYLHTRLTQHQLTQGN